MWLLGILWGAITFALYSLISCQRIAASLANDTNLGVEHLMIYTVASKTLDGLHDVTFLTDVWLKRITPVLGPNALPHQNREAIRGYMWSEDLAHFFDDRIYTNFMKNHLHHGYWLPQLMLETQSSDEPLAFQVQLQGWMDKSRYIHPQYPTEAYWVEVQLPAGAGDCFRIYDNTTSSYKHSFCLPAMGQGVCDALAPPEKYSYPNSPALYGLLSVLRKQGMTADEWDGEYRALTVKLQRNLQYHLAMGWSGLLLYVDPLGRSYFEAAPELAPYLQGGSLVLLSWDLQERRCLASLKEGKYSDAGYSWDKPFSYAHALLGLSNCGANIMLSITDIDEYFYTPGGQPWPSPLSCMRESAALPGGHKGEDPANGVALFSVKRENVAVGPQLTPDQEPALWASAASNDPGQHPLRSYKSIQVGSQLSPKAIVVPAFEFVFVRIAHFFPAHGAIAVNISRSCAVHLNVPNMHRLRQYGTKAPPPFPVSPPPPPPAPPGWNWTVPLEPVWEDLDHWLWRQSR